MLSSSYGFVLSCFIILGLISKLYVKLSLSPRVGCPLDNEGSWSIGVFYGDSPFSLKPLESLNIEINGSAAWPAANPVLTCASVADHGFLYNFVAEPFLYNQGNVLYLFFEMKNSITTQGDIGVARSVDKGVTWQHLGVALDEEWHISYPYVFEYNGQIYMMPEGSAKGDLRLYRSEDFPLKWTLDKIILKKPLVGSFIIKHGGKFWLFGSDHSGMRTQKKGQMEIWYSNSPLGPFIPHCKNPIYSSVKRIGARNGGRPFEYNGNLYRIGQDSGDAYGRRIRVFKIEVLNDKEFSEVEVPLGLDEPVKGLNAWNGARYHHLDVKRLSSGEWIGVMDGDRVFSGDLVSRFILGSASFIVVAYLVILLGLLSGFIRYLVPLSWCPRDMGKRSDIMLGQEKSNLFSLKVRHFFSRLNIACYELRGKVKHNTCMGKLVLVVISSCGVVLMCIGVGLVYGGNGAQEPYAFNDKYSQFTMLTMTYDARLWNLKMYVKHYSRCSSVREIVVVWNRGQPPDLSEFDSIVPVRIRLEDKNSLNNRFKIDPLIKTRGVLELDDDIMMSCDDIERGFRVWREYPDRIVGFYPRLANGKRLKYKGEKYARQQKGYNIILTGAAFMDGYIAFQRYWSEIARAGREFVDLQFNCEDILLNYLYANASSTRAVEYVRPTWAIDTSKLSGVAISRSTDEHYRKRSQCLEKFVEMYGSLANRKSKFNDRRDGWDV